MTKRNDSATQSATPTYIGVDLAKNSIHIHGVGQDDHPCINQKMRLSKLNVTAG